MPKNYKDMTVAELEKENQKLMAEKEAIKKRQLAIAKLLAGKQMAEAAKAKVEAMSEEERNLLRQVLGPAGIESKEAVGKPQK